MAGRARALRRQRTMLRVLESTIATLAGGLILWWVTNPAMRTSRPAAQTGEGSAVQAVPTAVAPSSPSFIAMEARKEIAPPSGATLLSIAPSQDAHQPALSTKGGGLPWSIPVGPILFYENFARYREGAATDWGQGTAVKTGLDRRKWLVSYVDGTHAVGRTLRLPNHFCFECRYSAAMAEVTRGLMGWWREPVGSRVVFVDSQGAKYVIQWVIRYGNDTARLDLVGSSLFAKKYYHSIRLPDGAAGELAVSQPTGILRIDRDNGLVTVSINSQTVVSDEMSQMGELDRFEIDVVKAASGSLSFTEFKVGR